MDKLKFQYVLFNLVQEKLKLREFPSSLAKRTVELYNTINPELFRGKKVSQVLPGLATVIARKIQDDMNQGTRESVVANPKPIAIKNMSHSELSSEKELLEEKMREINSRLSLPDPTNAPKAVIDPKITDAETDIKQTLKDMIMSSKETENDRYMSTSFAIDENRDLTQFEKSDIQINSFLGVNDLSTLQMLFNPESLYVRYYVVLDSDYRIVEDDSLITRFKWNYADSLNLQPGFANSTGSIRDVIGIRLYQPRIPYSAVMATSSKRVSVLIEEFAAQAFIGENGRRFHFLMRPNFLPGAPDPSIEISTEDYNDGLFHFRKPITTFDSLTISFGEPLNVIEYTAPFPRFFLALEFTCYKSDK